MVHGILLARVPRGEVDDLVQDVFLAAMRQLSALRDDGAFGGWLAMIARNRAHDYHRRAREWTELPDEIPAAKAVLKAAALTYVAAALQSVGTLIYYAMILSRRRN